MDSTPVYVKTRMPGKAPKDKGENGGQAWLMLNKPKREALMTISDKSDGAFVIRSSETRPDSFVLSYRFRGTIHNEVNNQKKNKNKKKRLTKKA
jgi:hypothetical protein